VAVWWVIRHTTDDIANFHGYWGHIEGRAGNRVTFKGSSEFDRTVLRDAAANDRLLFRDGNTGRPLGEARVVGTEGHVVVADRPVAAFRNAIVEWPDPAVITGHTFIRPGSAAIRLDSFHGGVVDHLVVPYSPQ
jgi:hypothetical protein